MKPKITIFIVFAVFFTSCATPTAIPTLTPTMAPTFTPTPAPTATPAYPTFDQQSLEQWGLSADNLTVWQDQDGKWWAGEKKGDKKLTIGESKDWELVVVVENLAPEIVTAAQEFFGPDFEVGVNGNVKDKVTGLDVPGFFVTPSADGTTWEWKRTYEYLGDPNFTVVGTAEDITVTPNGELDMYAWNYQRGEYLRQTYQFDGKVPGTYVEEELHSVSEFFAAVIADSSDDPNHQWDSGDAARKMGFALLDMEWGDDGLHIRWREMDHVNKNTLFFTENYVPILGSDGKWDIIPTAAWKISAISDKDTDKYGDIAFGVWYGKVGSRVMVVEGEYLPDADNLSEYWEIYGHSDGKTGLSRPDSE